jgi:hypothetical protein
MHCLPWRSASRTSMSKTRLEICMASCKGSLQTLQRPTRQFQTIQVAPHIMKVTRRKRDVKSSSRLSSWATVINSASKNRKNDSDWLSRQNDCTNCRINLRAKSSVKSRANTLTLLISIKTCFARSSPHKSRRMKKISYKTSLRTWKGRDLRAKKRAKQQQKTSTASAATVRQPTL